MEQESRTIHRILIVEDDKALADGLCRALQNETVETVNCHTLREADQLLRGARPAGADAQAGMGSGTQFDLVLLDVNLPDGSGFDFLVQMKKKCDINVIMLTANDMETDIVAGLELGADDYITKPFSLAVLRARVETQLRRVEVRARYGAPNETIEKSLPTRTENMDDGWILDGAYRFCFPQMLFFHGEEAVELSKTEQKLLRILVENRGTTVTRERLLDYVWTEEADYVEENALSVTVKRLRDKLDAQERIRTVYGIGYRWE